MRVGHNLLYLIPGKVGGTETYAWSTIRSLCALTSDHEYVAFANANSAAQPSLFPNGVEVIPINVDAQSRVRRYAAEQLILPQIAKRAKVDLLHSMGYVSVLRTNIPTVVTIHDVNYRHVPMPPTKRLTLAWFVRQSALRAQAIVTVSEFSKTEICTEFGVDPTKVWVTHNAPNPDVFGNWQDCGEEPASPPFVLVLSSPSPHKNIAGVVQAFTYLSRLHPDLRLVVAGHLAPGVSIPTHLLHRVDVTGYVGRERLLELYRRAACFVMPSLYEGFGIPVIEAMALGTPAAVSRRSALPEVGGDAVLYFDPNSVEEMVDTINRLLEDSQLRETLVARGRVRARSFSWEASARKLLNVYERVLSQ